MKILVIEGENVLREVIVRSLEKERYVVGSTSSFREASPEISDHDHDYIVLDIMFPGGSDLTLLEELRALRKKDSIITISTKNSIGDKATGLDLGTDDHLTKPFHLVGLNARIKSVTHRKQQDGELQLSLTNLTIYPDKHPVYINGKEIVLNRKELDPPHYFMSNPNRLISKTTLAESVRGGCIDQAGNSDFIYSQIRNLKKRLKAVGAILETRAVHDFGYKMADKE